MLVPTTKLGALKGAVLICCLAIAAAQDDSEYDVSYHCQIWFSITVCVIWRTPDAYYSGICCIQTRRKENKQTEGSHKLPFIFCFLCIYRIIAYLLYFNNSHHYPSFSKSCFNCMNIWIYVATVKRHNLSAYLSLILTYSHSCCSQEVEGRWQAKVRHVGAIVCRGTDARALTPWETNSPCIIVAITFYLSSRSRRSHITFTRSSWQFYLVISETLQTALDQNSNANGTGSKFKCRL